MPGIPETSELLYLAPGAMRLLPSQRVAGGTRFSLPAAGDGFALMTEDPQVIQVLRQCVVRDGAKTVQLERDLAVQRARSLAYCVQKLMQLGFKADVAASQAATINQQLSQLDAMVASGQIEQSQHAVAVVAQNLGLAEGEERQCLGGLCRIRERSACGIVTTLCPNLPRLRRPLHHSVGATTFWPAATSKISLK